MDDRRADAATGGLRLALVALVVLAVYALLWPAVTGDMRDFLVPWLDIILTRGRVGAFAEPFSNYTPPYLYLLSLFSLLAGVLPKIGLIKALSVAATVLLAFAARYLLGKAGSDRRLEAMLWLALLPSIAMNAAGFGQCDALWSAACVMAVASAIAKRPVAMLVWFGIGIAFKAQAVFLAPFILQRLLATRTPAWLWVLPGLVYWAAMLPAMLAGWPALDIATIYLRQTEWNPDFISNAANPWSLVQLLAPTAGRDWLWFGHLAAAGATIVYVAVFGRRDFGAKGLIALALLSALIVPFLLPKMHERFFFLADVLAFLLVWFGRDRRSIAIFLLVQGSSVLALAGLLFGWLFAPVLGAAMVAGAMGLTVAFLRAEQGVAGPCGGP